MSTLRWEDQDGFPEPELKERIRDLLRSHSPPPSNLSSTISVLSKELQKYDDKISQLKDELSRLESHRSALDAYHRDCRSLLAPIRRLPPEILGDVFRLCRSSRPDSSRSSDRAFCGIAHLAQESMLRASQVCILWHTIIMGTPSLWNTVALHASALGGTPHQTKVTIELIRVAFERSATLPLDVQLDGVRHAGALSLVASQSARWESAKISCNSSELGYLTAAKGNLPLLRSLELDTRWAEAPDLDFLESVPSLRALTVYGSIQHRMSKLPLKGLVNYECAELTPKAIRWAVASLSLLSPACDVHFRVDLVRWNHSTSLGLRIPETSSNINSLLLEVEYSFRTAHCLQAFDEIFAALTLPSLRHFSFTANEQLLPWPHQHFIALSIRSSFHTHLHSLNLLRVHITEHELVECLSTLLALRRLSVADRYGEPLLSNSLLSALTPLPEDRSACLVPHLRVLEGISEFYFDDEVFLDLLVSRCESGASEEGPFVSRLRCPYRRNPFNPIVAARLQDMCTRGVLKFQWPQ